MATKCLVLLFSYVIEWGFYFEIYYFGFFFCSDTAYGIGSGRELLSLQEQSGANR